MFPYWSCLIYIFGIISAALPLQLLSMEGTVSLEQGSTFSLKARNGRVKYNFCEQCYS